VEIKDRVKELVRVRPDRLVPCPWNFRVHPDKQREALKGVLGEVGIAGVQLVRELPDGRYMLIDGHLRREEYEKLLGRKKVPVVVLDVTEEEALKLLASHDPLAGMATTDGEALGKLLRQVETSSAPLAALFSELAAGSGALDPASLELDLEDDGSLAPEAPEQVQASHVRMVQLFLNTETQPRFEKFVALLAQEMGTRNLTDTVFEAMRRAYKAARKAGAEA
jgi:hypothetical protein